MDIGEVVWWFGVLVLILCYYEEKGLIVFSGWYGLCWLFDVGVLEWLVLIGLGCVVGLLLDEIVGMGVVDGVLWIDCVVLVVKVDELDWMICCFVVMCDGLWYVVVCLVCEYMDCLMFCCLLWVVVVGVIKLCWKVFGV